MYDYRGAQNDGGGTFHCMLYIPVQTVHVLWWSRETAHVYPRHVRISRDLYPFKDPDENVKQMVKKYVQENNIRRLYRMDHSGTCFHDCITFQIFWLFLNIWDLISLKTAYFQSWIYSKNSSVWKSIRKFRDRELSDIIHQDINCS